MRKVSLLNVAPIAPADARGGPGAGVGRDWHAVPTDHALLDLQSATTGLSEREAEARLGRYGPNRIPEPQGPGPLRRFLQQFQNVLIYVLLAAAAAAALMQHVKDALVILAVILVNAVAGFIQEGRAERALAGIRHMIDPHASVLRDGLRVTIPADQAYGPHHEKLVQNVPKDKFPPNIELKKGILITLKAPTGQTLIARVADLQGDVALLDMNHPLAGKTLHFKIKLLKIQAKK